MTTQKNRNLTVYTSDAKAASLALTAIAAALQLEGQRGPSPSELTSWLVLHKDKVIEALKSVRKSELERAVASLIGEDESRKK